MFVDEMIEGLEEALEKLEEEISDRIEKEFPNLTIKGVIIPTFKFNGKEINIKVDLRDLSIENKTAEYRDWETDRKSTRLNSSHSAKSRMPSSA